MLEALARALSRESGRMLVVEPPCSTWELLAKRRQLGRRAMLAGRLLQWKENLWILSPSWSELRPQVGRALSRLRGPETRSAAWIFQPGQGSLVHLANEEVVVYDCYDEYTLTTEGQPVPGVAEAERELLGQCDLVFASSQPLYESRRHQHSNAHYVPNGSDFVHLSDEQLQPVAGADDLADLSQPVVGCIGNLRPGLDFELLERIAVAEATGTLLMVGANSDPGVGPQVDRLSQGTKVRFIGHKPRALLPAYLSALAVGISPFQPTDYYHCALPNRVMDYLALGKPAVAYDVRCLHELKDVVYLARDREEFLTALTEAVENDTPEKRAQRRQRMLAYDLDALAEKRLAILKQTLA